MQVCQRCLDQAADFADLLGASVVVVVFLGPDDGDGDEPAERPGTDPAAASTTPQD